MRFILEESMYSDYCTMGRFYMILHKHAILCAYKRLLKSNIIALADNAK